MDPRISVSAIFDRLGVAAHDADFEIVACERCGRQSLADHEHLRVYTDPDDLRTLALNSVGEVWPACRRCGQADWDFVQAASIDEEWLWVCVDGSGTQSRKG